MGPVSTYVRQPLPLVLGIECPKLCTSYRILLLTLCLSDENGLLIALLEDNLRRKHNPSKFAEVTGVLLAGSNSTLNNKILGKYPRGILLPLLSFLPLFIIIDRQLCGECWAGLRMK